MSVRTLNKFLGLALLSLSVTACSGTKEMLGLNKSAPDEFAVYSRAPLSLPPDYSIKPPTPGAERPQTEEETHKAQRALLGQAPSQMGVSSSYENMTPGLRSLLEQTGAMNADNSIRQTVDRETSAYIAESEGFAEDLMFWRNKEAFGTKVDAAAEAQRIREAQALGQKVDGTGAVVIERKEKALLEGLIN